LHLSRASLSQFPPSSSGHPTLRTDDLERFASPKYFVAAGRVVVRAAPKADGDEVGAAGKGEIVKVRTDEDEPLFALWVREGGLVQPFHFGARRLVCV
jgi:hypothetical protein